jgi:aspartokinase
MEEIEVPTEHLHEHIKEKLEEEGEGKKSWSMYLAISTAIMAVLAAMGSLFAGHHSDEALIEQIKASDNWSYYQAKGTKYEIVSVMKEIKSDPAEQDKLDKKLEGYKKDQEEIKTEAKAEEEKSHWHLSMHEILARAVTIFQISIAISAIAMLTRRKVLWYASMLLSVVGIYFFIQGLG